MMVYYGMAVKRMGMLGMSVRGTDWKWWKWHWW